MVKLSVIKGLKILYMEDGKEINNIVIYGDGKELYKSNQPYITIVDENNREYDSQEIILVGDIKRANKVNLNRKDNFYVVDKENKYFSDKGYILYIHESEIKVNSVTEKVALKLKHEVNYKKVFNITLKGNIKYKEYDKDLHDYVSLVKNNVNITQRFYSKCELTEYGKKLKEIEEFFKNNKINITRYDLEKLIDKKDKLIELL